ncbi:MAG: hypothetical protein L3J03_04485 [Desulfobacterales bacterium]|nr:hypothetical protein [Desulfobacterales bacterium]
MSEINCWEYRNCGREPGGRHAAASGVCSAATYAEADGFCGGKNGGRSCVYITGTLCAGDVSGSYPGKLKDCLACDFYRLLEEQHGPDFIAVKFFEYVKRY